MKEHQSSKNEFKGGLDYDSDKLTMSSDNYTYGLNIRNGVAGKGKFGRVVSVKGNTKVNYTLYPGTNKCIGSYEYTPLDQVYYFVYNSQGNHTILRYDSTDIIEVVRFDFGWTADQKITHIDLVDGKLLYWVDPKPRKINLEKAITVGKIRQWNFYKIGTGNYNIRVELNGTVVYSLTENLEPEFLVDVLNTQWTAQGIGLEAQLCNGYLEIFQTTADNGYIISSGLQSITVAQNFYSFYNDERVYRGVYPFPCFPNVELKKNDDITYNFIDRKIFRFRTQLVKDDYSVSTLSSYSDITVNTCKTGFNYIEVDFTLGKFNQAALLEDIRLVRLYVQEIADTDATYDNAPWKIVTEVKQSELWEFSGVLGTNTFNFYNDSTYTVIDAALADKQYDALGIEIACQEFTDNRLVDANILENYDQPCFNAKVELGFEPINRVLYNISGIIRIVTKDYFAANSDSRNGPIIIGQSTAFPSDPDTFPEVPVFGGQKDQWYYSGLVPTRIGGGYGQYIPTASFKPYLAGTPYYAASRQIQVPLSQNADGAIDLSSADNVTKLQDYLDGGGEIYSEYKIEGVPNGVYELRLPSNLCSNGDIVEAGELFDLNNGQAFQRTSMPVLRFIDGSNGTVLGHTSITININSGNWAVSSFLGDNLMTGTAAPNGEIFIGEMEVLDLSGRLSSGLGERSVTGYLLDADASSTLEDLKEGVAMELQEVRLVAGSQAGGPFDGVIIHRGTTDHNGFFYFCHIQDSQTYTFINAQSINGYEAKTSLDVMYVQKDTSGRPNGSVLKGLYAGTLSLLTDSTDYPGTALITTGIGNYTTTQLLINNSNPDVTQNARTVIRGRVEDTNGNGVDGVSVVFERTGRQETTDANGDFSILVYGAYAEATGRNLDDLLINSGTTCPAYFSGTISYIQLPLNIDPISSAGYNNTTSYQPSFLNPIIVTIPAYVLDRYFKGGGKYKVALMFVDNMNRRHNIYSNPSIDFYIPFITENVNRYISSVPSQVSDGTFRATLNLTDTEVPEWAVKLYILITKNSNYNNYLQFPVNEVKYVVKYNTADSTTIDTSYSTFTANEVYLNFQTSLQNYREYNSDSTKAWAFAVGDRIRPIRKKSGEYFTNADGTIVDFAIKAEVGNFYAIDNLDSLPEMEPGDLFEIYTPKLQTEEELFFEVPLCIDIVNAGTPLRALSQSTLLLDIGDTYRRARIVPITGAGPAVTYIEDNSVSDFYQSDVIALGRINFEDDTFRQMRRTNALRYSNQYVSDTKINGLSSFEPASVIQLPYSYGDINFLTNTSDDNYREVLLAVCSNRCASIYVGEVLYSDVQGQSFIATSNKVLGTYRMLKGEFGTQHPESVVVMDGNAWWWDGIRGRFIKYSQNGLNPISDYFMASYAQGKLQEYTGLTYKVDGAYDRYYRDVIWTFQGIEEVEAQTLVFNEIKNLWTSFFSFIPEEYATLNDKVLSFKNGELWVHDSNAIHNNFYGVQYASQIKFVSSLNPYQLKIFYCFRENANKKWHLSDITTPPNSSYPVGMKSRVKSGNIKLYEGDFWGDFLRDMNDPYFYNQPPENALLRGRRLRGGMIEILLENNDTTEADLKFFEVYSYPSENTNA